MSLIFLEFFQRHIQDDINFIISPHPDFFDELMQDRLPFIEVRIVINICPGEKVAAFPLHFFGSFLHLLLFLFCFLECISSPEDRFLVFSDQISQHITVKAALALDHAKGFFFQNILFLPLCLKLPFELLDQLLDSIQLFASHFF